MPLAGTLPLLPVEDALGELARLDGGGLLAAALDAAPGYVREEVGRLLPGMGPGGGTGPPGRDGASGRADQRHQGRDPSHGQEQRRQADGAGGPHMNRLEATKLLISKIDRGPVVASLGHPAYDLFAAGDRHSRWACLVREWIPRGQTLRDVIANEPAGSVEGSSLGVTKTSIRLLFWIQSLFEQPEWGHVATFSRGFSDDCEHQRGAPDCVS